jgi:hypothetical protein
MRILSLKESARWKNEWGECVCVPSVLSNVVTMSSSLRIFLGLVSSIGVSSSVEVWQSASDNDNHFLFPCSGAAVHSVYVASEGLHGAAIRCAASNF